MSLSTLSQAGILLLVSVSGAYYLATKVSAQPEQNVAAQAPAAVETVQSLTLVTPPSRSASVVSIPRRDGQFFTHARVNSGSVDFLIDTGASVVALTLADARKAGINTATLHYDQGVNTANGLTYAAAVILDDITVGGIRLRNVEGVVMKEGLHTSLLGMTFLGKLQKVEATPHQLILRL